MKKLQVDLRFTTHLIPLPTHVAKESTVAESRTKKTSKVTKPSAKDKAPLCFKAQGPRMPEELRPCHEAEVSLWIQSRSWVCHFGQP